jgi:hypothetical protein
MEISKLSRVAVTTRPWARATTPAISMAAPPVASCVDVPVRTRSMPGVGVHRVPADWSIGAQLARKRFANKRLANRRFDDTMRLDQAPHIKMAAPARGIVIRQQDQGSTYTFSPRQGPPTCSPPV